MFCSQIIGKLDVSSTDFFLIHLPSKFNRIFLNSLAFKFYWEGRWHKRNSIKHWLTASFNPIIFTTISLLRWLQVLIFIVLAARSPKLFSDKLGCQRCDAKILPRQSLSPRAQSLSIWPYKIRLWGWNLFWNGSQHTNDALQANDELFTQLSCKFLALKTLNCKSFDWPLLNKNTFLFIFVRLESKGETEVWNLRNIKTKQNHLTRACC